MLHDSVYVRVFVLVCKGGHGSVPDTDRHGPKWARDHSDSGQEPDPDSHHRTQHRKGTCPKVHSLNLC